MGINFVIILDLVVNIHRSGGGPSGPPPPTEVYPKNWTKQKKG